MMVSMATKTETHHPIQKLSWMRDLFSRPVERFIPLRLLLFTIISVLAAEIVVAWIIPELPPHPTITESIIDGLVTTLLMVPILYVFLFIPIRNTIHTLENTQQALNHTLEELQSAHDELETRIQERTADLASANENLERRNRDLQALNSFGSQIIQSFKLANRVATLQKYLCDVIGISAGRITLFPHPPDMDESIGDVTWGCTPPEFPLEAASTKAVALAKPVLLPVQSNMTGGGAEQRPYTYVGIPLITRNENLGILDLFTQAPQPVVADQIPFFEAMGNQVAALLHNAHLYQAEIEARQVAETLLQAGQVLAQNLDVQQVTTVLLELVQKNIPGDGALIFLMADQDHVAVYAHQGDQYNLSATEVLPVSLALFDYPLLKTILSTRKSCYIEDTKSEPAWRPFFGKTSTRSWLGVPILGGEQVIGVCILESSSPQAYQLRHIALTETLASQAAIAVHNAWLFDQVRTGRERLRALSRRLVDTQEKERRYIARELHDQTSQALIYLKVVLELMKSDSHDPEKVLAGVAEIDRITGEVLDGLHRLSADIRPASLDLLGLSPALRQYIENLTGKYGLQIHLDVTGLDTRLPADVEISLYRIVQEALSNTVRHAKATRADVLIINQPGKILAQINDDGIGFDGNEALFKGRLGLFGMRERAEMLGGLLKVNTAAGCGTQLTIEIPYATNQDPYRR